MKYDPIGIDYSKTIFSPRWFMENMLYIVNKKGELVRFRLNKEQSTMLEHIEFCLDNGLPIRMMVLKARQIGSTTLFAALGFWFSAMNRNVKYGIVAHMIKSAESIFQKCKLFYNNLPKEMQPKTTQMSSEGITFDTKSGNGINSKIQFATVNEGVFRGQTLSYLHLTECAFWEGNVQAIENSLSPTVSYNPNTMIVRESTANGYNFFKDDWDRAVKGLSDYKTFFFGWQDHEEYKMRVPKHFKLTEKEQELKERFNLSDEQLAWRRYTIENDYKGNATWFAQEYPMTATEAFVAAGTGVFNAETVVKGYEECIEPEKIKLTSYPVENKLLVFKRPETYEEKIYAQRSQWSYKKQAYEYVDTDLLLEEKTYKRQYTIGIDTAGLGSDHNQIAVVDNETKELVARFGQKIISEKGLALVAVEIAKMYNNALIAPEVNYSPEICNYILDEYKNVYIRESITKKHHAIQGIEYGFKTTQTTKPPIISSLSTRLDEEPALIKDKDFWYEAEYYIMDDPSRNKMSASSGHRDDIIMAVAIAMYVSDSRQAKQRPVVTTQENEGQGHFMNDVLRKHKKPKIRKGIYNNEA